MNGPVQMYRTKQIIRQDVPVELPKCMYNMRSIHSSAGGGAVVADQQQQAAPKLDITEQANSSKLCSTVSSVLAPQNHLSLLRASSEAEYQKNNNLPAMAALEARQQNILKQLAALKKQMHALKADLNSSGTTTRQSSVKTVAVAPVDVNYFPDVVINASPDFPPYSLKLIQQLWKNNYKMNVQTHLHSSVAKVPEGIATFASQLEKFETQGKLPVLNVRLIWKDVGANTELVISPVIIMGEVNILRYLSRINPSSNYDTLDKPYELDIVLDTCYRLVRTKTKTERAKLIQTLNKSLGKGVWLCGRNEMTIADVAAASAVKQVAEGEIGANLSKWYQRCQAVM